ncbi:MAG: DinB superfamily protein [Acidobacteriales bacterium]|nr:DinB superfamily protein [Terriglobales bacterium]
MGELDRITDQLRRAWKGEAWHGPSLSEVLEGVTSTQAQQKPVSGAHSIWELVLHLTTWTNVARRRFEGELFEVSESEDWPPMSRTNPEDWAAALGQLNRANESLLSVMETAAQSDSADSKLNQITPGKDHSIYILLHGTVQHHLYHAGQIAILKKALI